MTKPTGRRPGAPLKLHDIIDQEKGTTVGDRIIAIVQAGEYFDNATAAAGVNRSTGHDWLKRGARLIKASIRNPDTAETWTDDDRALAEFSNAVAQARAEAGARDITTLARLAAGGIKQEVVTEKRDGAGKLIERTVRTESTLPSERAILWRMERRDPTHWQAKTRVEVTGADGDPLEVQVSESDAVQDLLAQIAELKSSKKRKAKA